MFVKFFQFISRWQQSTSFVEFFCGNGMLFCAELSTKNTGTIAKIHDFHVLAKTRQHQRYVPVDYLECEQCEGCSFIAVLQLLFIASTPHIGTYAVDITLHHEESDFWVGINTKTQKNIFLAITPADPELAFVRQSKKGMTQSEPSPASFQYGGFPFVQGLDILKIW